jgi:hypothetical protein
MSAVRIALPLIVALLIGAAGYETGHFKIGAAAGIGVGVALAIIYKSKPPAPPLIPD